MFCRNCGKEIADDASFCPNCGTCVKKSEPQSNSINNQAYNYTANNQSYGYAPQPAPKDTTNTIAIVGFVLSFFFAIAGLICSIIGYKKAKEEGLDNKGLALAGIIISSIEIAIIVLYIFIVVFIIGSVLGGLNGWYYGWYY